MIDLFCIQEDVGHKYDDFDVNFNDPNPFHLK